MRKHFSGRGYKGKQTPHLQNLRRYFVTPRFCFLPRKGGGIFFLNRTYSMNRRHPNPVKRFCEPRLFLSVF